MNRRKNWKFYRRNKRKVPSQKETESVTLEELFEEKFGPGLAKDVDDIAVFEYRSNSKGRFLEVVRYPTHTDAIICLRISNKILRRGFYVLLFCLASIAAKLGWSSFGR